MSFHGGCGQKWSIHCRDPELAALIQYMETGELAKANSDACTMVVLELFFSVEIGALGRLLIK